MERGSGLAAIIARREKELNQRPGERPIVPGCNGNCEILLRESNCMHSSSGIPLCHWWSQWRLGWIETRYLLSHARKNRQLPEIGFHFDVLGSVAYNCHCILLFNLFPFPFLSLYYSFSSLPFLSFSLLSLFVKLFHFFHLSFTFPESGTVMELRCRKSVLASFVFPTEPLLWLFGEDRPREWSKRRRRTALWEGVSAWLVMDPALSVWCCQSRVLQHTDHK